MKPDTQSSNQAAENLFKNPEMLKKHLLFALSLTKDFEEAESLLQDAILILLSKKDSANIQNPEGFLMQIIKNKFIDDYRKKGTRQKYETYISHSKSFAYTSQGYEWSQELQIYLDRIRFTNQEQEVFALLRQEFKAGEIAQKLGLTTKKVSATIYGIKQKFKKLRERLPDSQVA